MSLDHFPKNKTFKVLALSVVSAMPCHFPPDLCQSLSRTTTGLPVNGRDREGRFEGQDDRARTVLYACDPRCGECGVQLVIGPGTRVHAARLDRPNFRPWRAWMSRAADRKWWVRWAQDIHPEGRYDPPPGHSGPAEPGLDRTRWAHAELVDHFVRPQPALERRGAVLARASTEGGGRTAYVFSVSEACSAGVSEGPTDVGHPSHNCQRQRKRLFSGTPRR